MSDKEATRSVIVALLSGKGLQWACDKSQGGGKPYYPDPWEGYGSGPVWVTQAWLTDGRLVLQLVKKYGISLQGPVQGNPLWHAHIYGSLFSSHGDTPEEAVVRCVVVKELGTTIQVPKALV